MALYDLPDQAVGMNTNTRSTAWNVWQLCYTFCLGLVDATLASTSALVIFMVISVI